MLGARRLECFDSTAWNRYYSIVLSIVSWHYICPEHTFPNGIDWPDLCWETSVSKLTLLNNSKLILKSLRRSLGVCIWGCNNLADAKTIGSLPTLRCSKHSMTTWLKALFPIGHKFACIYDAFLDRNVSTKKCNFQNIFEVSDFILAPLKFSSYSTFYIRQIPNYKLYSTKLQITNSSASEGQLFEHHLRRGACHLQCQRAQPCPQIKRWPWYQLGII